MRRATIVGVSFFALLATSKLAVAGMKQTYQVSINQTYRTVMGVPGSARASGDSKQYIGCFTDDQASSTHAGCTASDSSGNTIYIWRDDSNPNIIQAIRSIKGESRIYAQWDGSGQIIYIEVVNNSTAMPMSP